MTDFSAIIPSAILAAGLLAVIAADLLTKGRRPELAVTLAMASLLGAALAAVFGVREETRVVLGVLRPDGFGITMTVFCCVTGFLTIWGTMRGEAFRRPGGEFLVLILSAVLGMTILSQAVDLVALYLAFETVSIPSYVLVGMRRGDRAANESSMKYVLFGAVSSGLMLYGLSMIVGLCGGTSLDTIAQAVAGGVSSQPMFVVAVVLVFAGFAFKISAVPFHFWSPDVYAGAPASVGGFLAVASKAAGFAALVRVVGALSTGVPDVAAGDRLTTVAYTGDTMAFVVAVAAILSMTIGNLGALKQTEVKRLLAWSSIAHAGYILLALAVWSKTAAAALIVYLIAYLFMNLAAFFIAGMVIREQGNGELKSFRGLGFRSPWIAASFAIVLFSLTGLPPFLGFVGKFALFAAVFEKGYVWLGVIGLLNGVVSLYYYAKIISWMFLKDAEETDTAKPFRFAFADGLLLAVLVVPVLVFGILWSGLWEIAQGVVPAIFGG